MDAFGDLNADHAALGLAVGAVVVAGLVLVPAGRPWAPAIVAGATVPLVADDALAAVALAAAVGLLSIPRRATPLLLVVAVAVAAGSLTLLALDPVPPAAVGLVVLVGVPAGALGLRAVADHASPVLLSSLVVLTFGGAYGCLPDTEAILRALGVLVPVAALAAVPAARSSAAAGLRAPGAPAVLLLAIAAESARGEPAPVVGVAGSLGLLLVLPLAAAATRRPVPRASVWLTGLVLLQLVVVAVCSRVAGVGDDGPAAVGIVAAALGGALLVSALVLVAASPARPPR